MTQTANNAASGDDPRCRKLLLKWAAGLVAVVVTLQIGLSAHLGGADVYRYLRLARALHKCDLWVEGSTLSPTGVIIDHHAVGPGLSWLPFLWVRRVVERIWGRASPPLIYAYGAHFLYAVLLAVLIERTLHRARITGYQKCAALFLAFSGTALSYYAFLAVSSELLAALTVFGLFTYLYCNSDSEGKWRFYAYAGMLAGAAVTVRGSNVVLVAPVVVLICCRAFGLRVWRQAVLRCLVFAAAVFGAVFPFLTTNWLFTGSALRTPVSYRLPSGHYIWFDWSDLHMQEVLFSHWHGLFVYSPVLILAVAGFVIWVRRDLAERGGARHGPRTLTSGLPYAFATGFVMQLLLYSAWRCWWMGTATFGGRQFTQAMPFAALGVGLLLKRTNATRLWHPVLLPALLLTAWTVGLYLQAHGRSNFPLSYAQVLSGQAQVLREQPAPFLGWVVALVASGLWRGNGRVQLCALLGLMAVTIVRVGGHYVGTASVPGLDRGALSLLALGGIAGIAGFYTLSASRPQYGVVAASLLVASTALFVGAAAARTRHRRSIEPVPSHQFRAPFDVRDWLKTYEEYAAIPGYEWERARYRALIQEFADLLTDEGTEAQSPNPSPLPVP